MEYTLVRIRTLCESDRHKAAEELDKAAIAVDTRMQNDYHLAGVISWGVKEYGIWQELGWQSFTAWFDDRWAGSRSSSWESYDTLDKLQEHVPESEIKQMQRCKRVQLADCPSSAPKQDPEMWEKAKDRKVTEREFCKAVNEKHSQHLECRGPYLRPSDSQREVYEEACTKAREECKDETMSREACFEWISQSYLQAPYVQDAAEQAEMRVQ